MVGVLEAPCATISNVNSEAAIKHIANSHIYVHMVLYQKTQNFEHGLSMKSTPLGPSTKQLENPKVSEIGIRLSSKG